MIQLASETVMNNMVISMERRIKSAGTGNSILITIFFTNPPGAYCDNFMGYCDVFSKCRKVDAEGPFKQLTDIIFDPVTFKNILVWIEVLFLFVCFHFLLGFLSPFNFFFFFFLIEGNKKTFFIVLYDIWEWQIFLLRWL